MLPCAWQVRRRRLIRAESGEDAPVRDDRMVTPPGLFVFG